MRFTLPIGLDFSGRVLRDVEIVPPTGGLLKRMRDAVTGKDRTAIYQIALSFGLESIEGMPGKPTREVLGRLCFADVEYVFFRMAELDCAGTWPLVVRTCPSCDKEFKQEIDLSAVEIISLDGSGKSAFDNEGRSIAFTLKHGITTLDTSGAAHKSGRLGLITFDDWVKVMSGKAGIGTSMARSIAAAIVELGPAGHGEVTEADLDCLPASDTKMLENLYNKNVPGVQFPAEVDCPHCANRFMVPPVDVVSDFLLRSAV